MSIAKALLAFQADAPPIHLDATNPHFRNKYASLGGVVAAIRPALNKHGLVYTQLPTNLAGVPALRTVLMHAETGEQLEDTMPLMLTKQDSQAQGSALTYGRRYALLSILGLVGDDDDDGNSTRSAPVPSGVGGAVEPPSQTAPASSSSTTGADGSRTPAAQGAGAPAPSPFSPPEGAIPSGTQDERNAAAAGRVTVGFGKNKGKTLDELGSKQVGWYAEVWEPDTLKFAVSPIDRQLRQAARLLAGVEPMVETDGPFGPAPAVDDPADDGIPF